MRLEKSIIKFALVSTAMATFLALVSIGASAQSTEECTCTCVNGEVQPLCSSTLSIPPICSPQVCEIVPPSIKPIDPIIIPPIGTDKCEQEQVYNGDTQEYEWKTVCHKED